MPPLYQVLPPSAFDGSGRRLVPDPNANMVYSARSGASVLYGPALRQGELWPFTAGAGDLSAVAADPDGNAWVAFRCDDTIWCLTGEQSVEPVWAGDGSRVPGQPSIAIYPLQDNG
ncbi:MAG: hypothetical protein R6X12_08135, partial [bacterium]